MITGTQEFEGTSLVLNPTARLDTDHTVRLETPGQWYHLEDLTGYIKFLKGIRKQLKKAMAE